jgi:hypothetical protein
MQLKEIFNINENIYIGADLIDLNEVLPISGNIDSLNLLFNPKTQKISEPGIYAIFFEDLLLYIGKYQGKSKDPFGGCVNRNRWCKHLATITLRGKKVSCKRATLTRIKSDKNFKNKFYEIFGEFDENVFIGDRGCITVEPRIKFALDKWSIFEKLTSHDLSRFKFHYISLQHDKEIDTEKYRKAISDLEEKFIGYFHPLLNVKGKDSSKTKIVDIDKYRDFLKSNLSLSENEHEVEELFKNSKSDLNKDAFDIEDNNLDLFFKVMERKGINPRFVDESISYLDSNTSLDYYFTHIPDFRISGSKETYKNGNIIKRVLITIKIPKVKKEIKLNALLPIEYLDKSLLRFSRTVKDTLPTEISIPFVELDNNSDLLSKVLFSIHKYHDSKEL